MMGSSITFNFRKYSKMTIEMSIWHIRTVIMCAMVCKILQLQGEPFFMVEIGERL